VILRVLKQALLLAALALVPALICSKIQLRSTHEEPLAPGEIRAASVRQWGNQVQWVDARSQARYEAGHIPGAVLLNLENWESLIPKFLDAWDLEKTVVVYCDGGSCDASRAVADRLREDYQVKSIYVLKGGWPAWQAK
jgi:rhodanese-related sulfurtransferase